jgi:TPR repeat protein
VEWYELASKEGSEKGRYHAARCYHEGVGGAREDRAKAADVLGASVWELGVRRDRGVAAREREKENERGSRVPV